MRAIRETFQHIVILAGAATKTTQAPLLNVLSFSVTRCVGPRWTIGPGRPNPALDIELRPLSFLSLGCLVNPEKMLQTFQYPTCHSETKASHLALSFLGGLRHDA